MIRWGNWCRKLRQVLLESRFLHHPTSDEHPMLLDRFFGQEDALSRTVNKNNNSIKNGRVHFRCLSIFRVVERRTFLMGESPESALVVEGYSWNTKGVHREVESEGRCRQISGLTNRNHIRLQLRIRLPYKLKSNNYSELTVVNVADGWERKKRVVPREVSSADENRV